MTPREIEMMEADAYETVQSAVAQAQRDPAPDAAKENWRPLASSWLIEGGA
jgi:hypothetical protein